MNPQSESNLDVLAIGPHPDDAELFAGGTLALLARRGWRVGILSLTRGEMATRGTPELRAVEAATAAERLGIAHLEIMDLGDCDLANTQERRIAVVEAIRRLRPSLIITHHPDDRHPDHRRTHELVRDSAFFANVGQFPADGPRWLIDGMAFFLGNVFHPDARADWVVDVSETWQVKIAALESYASQFHAPADDPNATYIASRAFWEQIERRARLWGHRIGADFAEPFVLDRPPHANHPMVRMTGTDKE